MAAANNSLLRQGQLPQQQLNRHVAPEYISFPLPPPPPPPPPAYHAAMYDPTIAFYYLHLPPFNMAGESYYSSFASSSSAPLMPVPYYPSYETHFHNPPYSYPQGYSPPHDQPQPQQQQQPLMPPFLQGLHLPRMNMARLAFPCQKMADPEAKLFVGDLPIQMPTDAMLKELTEKFSFHGPCSVNIIWKPIIARVNEKPVPTGWIQYTNFIDANAALMWAKNEGFRIGNRAVRVERADGRRICRLYPSHPHAAPTLEDFKEIMEEFIHWTGKQKNVRMPIHVSDKIEIVEKDFRGKRFPVPSVGVSFRWCEDAQFAQDKFPKFSPQYRMDIERVSITNDMYWRLPSDLPEHHLLLSLNGLGLDPSEVWRQDRQRLREQREQRYKLRLQWQRRAATNCNNKARNNNNNHANGASNSCYDFVDKLPPEILRFPKQSAASRFNSRRGSSAMEKKTSYIIGVELRDIYDPALESVFMV